MTERNKKYESIVGNYDIIYTYTYIYIYKYLKQRCISYCCLPCYYNINVSVQFVDMLVNIVVGLMKLIVFFEID